MASASTLKHVRVRVRTTNARARGAVQLATKYANTNDGARELLAVENWALGREI